MRLCPQINKWIVQLDVIELGDLPILNGIYTDYRSIQIKAQHTAWCNENLFVQCAVFQKVYRQQLWCMKSDKTFENRCLNFNNLYLGNLA